MLGLAAPLVRRWPLWSAASEPGCCFLWILGTAFLRRHVSQAAGVLSCGPDLGSFLSNQVLNVQSLPFWDVINYSLMTTENLNASLRLFSRSNFLEVNFQARESVWALGACGRALGARCAWPLDRLFSPRSLFTVPGESQACAPPVPRGGGALPGLSPQLVLRPPQGTPCQHLLSPCVRVH